jgi:hypothetical protein
MNYRSCPGIEEATRGVVERRVSGRLEDPVAAAANLEEVRAGQLRGLGSSHRATVTTRNDLVH